jgi:hypothetical protein
MGLIKVNTPTGTFNFTIEGDTPTLQEKLKIKNILDNQPKKKVAQETKDPSFDTTTGVKDKKLRTALSFADTAQEEEAVLQKFGLQEGQYLRDSRGRLALNPEGAQMFGIETDKNVLIDESKLSVADIFDLAGIVPEVGGSVAGAIGGTLIGGPIGGVIGAGIGGGSGNLFEEAGEAIAGTSKQTAGEIAKQTATEAAIAAAGEGIFSLVGKAFKTFARGPAGKGVSDEQLKLIRDSRELGIDPSANLMGAPALVARQQALAEKIFKTSPRLKKNNETLNKMLDDLRSVGGNNPEVLGEALKIAGKASKEGLKKSERDAANNFLDNYSKITNQIIANMDGVVSDISKASIKDVKLDKDLMKAFENSFKTFADEASVQFRAADDVIQNALGDAKIFNSVEIKEFSKINLGKLKGTNEQVAVIKNTLKDIESLGDNASFAQLYSLRKSLKDDKHKFLGQKGWSSFGRIADQLTDKIDDITKPSVIEAMPSSAFRGLGRGSKASILAASNSVKEARRFYKEGMDKFDALEEAGVLRGIKNKVLSKQPIEAEGIFNSLIKKDKPQILKNLALVFDKQNLDQYTNLKRRMSQEWVRRTLKESIDPVRPNKFKPAYFNSELKKLGSTADELFGNDISKIRNLANQLEAVNLKNVDELQLDEFIKANADETSQGVLENLIRSQENLKALNDSKSLQKLAKGRITNNEAAELIVSPNTTSDELRTIMKSFEGNQEATNNLKSYFMEDVIGDFGDNFLLEPKSYTAFANRIQKANEAGKLEIIYGKEQADRMAKFASVLKFNAKTAEGGDLIAANIAASPLQNLGKLAKYSILGRLFSSEVFYKNFEKQLATKGVTFGSALRTTLGQFITQQTAESVEEGSRQAEAIFESGTKPNKSSVSMPMPNVSPPAPGSSLSNVSPVQPRTPTPRLSPSQVRQRAIQNPALASSLLGGLGSASLLNR